LYPQPAGAACGVGGAYQQSGLSRGCLLPLQKAPNDQPCRCFRSCSFVHPRSRVAILRVYGIVGLPVWAWFDWQRHWGYCPKRLGLMTPLESGCPLTWSVQPKGGSSLWSPCFAMPRSVPRSVPAIRSAFDCVIQSCQPRTNLLKYSPLPLPRGGALAALSGPDARALNSLGKFRKVALITPEPPVFSRQMAGWLGYNYVPGVQLRVVANDDAHLERRSVRNRLSRFVTPRAIISPTFLSNPPLIERKAPGMSLQPSGLIPCPKLRYAGSLFAKPQPPGFAQTFIRGHWPVAPDVLQGTHPASATLGHSPP
jgi:hypothetical protein